MAETGPDALFERFRRTGDPGALAALFDAVAPELLRVACYLVGDVHLGEDLVQTTFLRAIKSSAEWDPARPVLPWLLGILANRARSLRRSEARKLDRARLRSGLVQDADPAAAAAERELARALDAALQRLPLRYRQVLVLHLVHGLGGHEIATALAIAPSTVRAQICRGLELLRKSLPAGFAAGVAVTAATGRGLGAVRAAVLACAESAAAPAPAGAGVALITTGAGMKQPALVLSALVAVAVGTWVAVAGMDSAAPPVIERARDPAGHAAATPLRRDGALASVRAPVAPVEPGQLRSDAQQCAALRVRVVRAAAGTPVCDAGVRIRRPGAEDDGDTELRTDASGICRFQGLAAGALVIHVDRCRETREVQLAAGADTDVEIVLPSGLTVRGEVVAADGSPVGGAEVWSDTAPSHGARLARADAHGRFEVLDVPNAASLWARARGHGASAPAMLDGASGAQVTLRLPLGPAALRWEGRVARPDGSAAGRALVGVFVGAGEPGDGARTVVALVADDAGAFHCDEVPPGSHLVLARSRSGEGPWIAHAALRIDPHGVPPPLLLRLGDGGVVHGTVRDVDGNRLAGRAVRALLALPTVPAIAPRLTEVGATSAADGTYRLPALPPGLHRMSVVHRGAAAARAIELAPGELVVWDPVLARAASLSVRVSDEQGGAQPGWWVRVHVGAREAASGITAADGRFVAHGVGDGACSISVHPLVETPTGPAGAPFPAAVRDGVSAAAGAIEIVIPSTRVAAAELTGTVLDGNGAPIDSARVQLTRIGWRESAAAHSEVGTGRFAAQVPAGRYHIAITPPGGAMRTLTGVEVAAGQRVDLGDLVFATPATVRVRIVDEVGRPFDHAVLRTRPESGAAFDRADTPGSFTAHAVAPGRYTLLAHGREFAPVAVDFALASAGERTIELSAPRAEPTPIEIRLPDDPGGRQVLFALLTVHDIDGNELLRERLIETLPRDERAFGMERCLPTTAAVLRVAEREHGWRGESACRPKDAVVVTLR